MKVYALPFANHPMDRGHGLLRRKLEADGPPHNWRTYNIEWNLTRSQNKKRTKLCRLLLVWPALYRTGRRLVIDLRRTQFRALGFRAPKIEILFGRCLWKFTCHIRKPVLCKKAIQYWNGAPKSRLEPLLELRKLKRLSLECVRKSVKRFSDKTHDKTKS